MTDGTKCSQESLILAVSELICENIRFDNGNSGTFVSLRFLPHFLASRRIGVEKTLSCSFNYTAESSTHLPDESFFKDEILFMVGNSLITNTNV